VDVKSSEAMILTVMNRPGYFKMEILEPALQGHGFKSHGSLQFFRLLYAIAKIAFIAARIIALPDFILAVQYMSYY